MAKAATGNLDRFSRTDGGYTGADGPDSSVSPAVPGVRSGGPAVSIRADASNEQGAQVQDGRNRDAEAGRESRTGSRQADQRLVGSRTDGAGESAFLGARRPEVQCIADALNKGWANAPRIVVFSGMQVLTLEEATRKQAIKPSCQYLSSCGNPTGNYQPIRVATLHCLTKPQAGPTAAPDPAARHSTESKCNAALWLAARRSPPWARADLADRVTS